MDQDWKESRKRKYVEEVIDLTDDQNNNDDCVQKPVCKYGSKCYRKNPSHLVDFSHPLLEESEAKTSNETENNKLEPKFYFTKINDVPNASEINKYNSINLSDILSKDADQFIESAQFNFMFEYDWLIKQYPAKNRTKPMTVIDGGGNNIPSKPHLKVVSAKFDNIYGKHHSKMMFLLYETGMRIVIHTANLIEIDWYQKTNGVWISDLFPRINTESKASNIKSTDSKTNFKQYLIMYLEHYNKKELNEWINHVKGHDMKTANVFLVASVPGRFSSTKRVYGILRLEKILQDYFIRDNQDENEDDDENEAKSSKTSKTQTDRLVCQFSSIGSLGPNENSWLCGEFKTCLSACKNKSNISTSLPICIYPTIENVLKSFEGVMAGGSLPYGEATANKQKYLENFFYKWKADSVGRTRCMPHIKTFARYSNDFTKLYWFLLTSANLSKAAWGKYEKKDTQIFIMSYEIGVLYLPNFEEENKRYFDLKNKSEFMLPYDLPPIKYSKPKDQPWVI